MLIDTHFHLYLMDNMQILIQEFRTADVGIIAVGTTPKAYTKENKLCFGIDTIRVSLGMHPQLVAEREQELGFFLQLLEKSKFIGEVGLDFNSGHITSKSQQLYCFRKIAKACAEEGGKILSIHSVKAAGVVIEELSVAGTFLNNICIFHWFSGTATERKKAIEAGAWFSINPKMLRTNSGRETIKALPSERILLETDAPFTMKFKTVADLKSELDKLVIGISAIRGEDMFGMIENNSKQVLL